MSYNIYRTRHMSKLKTIWIVVVVLIILSMVLTYMRMPTSSRRKAQQTLEQQVESQKEDSEAGSLYVPVNPGN